jgi:hypothetical protein
MLIARSGKDVSKLTTREEVHSVFGEPDQTGVVEGHPYEDYWTRRKISEQMTSDCLSLGLGMTYGTFELIAFPIELWSLCKGTVLGKILRFAYDDQGRVMRVFLDGETVLFHSLDRWAVEEYEREKKAAETPKQQCTDSP